MATNRGFYYVYIPSDEGEIEERFFHGDSFQLRDFEREIKKYFTRKMLKQQMTEPGSIQLIAPGGINNPLGLTDLDSIADELMNDVFWNCTRDSFPDTIELFPVLLPTNKTRFMGITVYIDNKERQKHTKNLKRNNRLTELVQSAGYPDQIFYDDAFISSTFDDQHSRKINYIDFRKKHFTKDAKWIKLARWQITHKQGPQKFSDLIYNQSQSIGEPTSACIVQTIKNVSIDTQGEQVR